MINDPVLAVAVRAARRAGSVIVDAARDLKRLPAHAKEHGDIVTAADNEAEDAIVATIRAAFPEHAILGEESGHIEGARDRRRIQVDRRSARRRRELRAWLSVFRGLGRARRTGPRSRTRSCSIRCATSSIAAIRGKGAQLNGVAIRTSSCMTLEQALVSHGLPAAAGARRWPRTFPSSTRSSRNARACGAPMPPRSISPMSPPAVSTASG